MVKVATRQAENPVSAAHMYIICSPCSTLFLIEIVMPIHIPVLQVGALAKKLRIPGMAAEAPKLSLPGKLVFPSVSDSNHFSMLGLGDIVSIIIKQLY